MIRLYGPQIGYGSFARVAAGMRHGLSELGRLDGFVPIDMYDEEDHYPGSEAPIGVYVGPPTGVSMLRNGWHERRLAMLAVNSTWVPENLVQYMEQYVTGFLAPSAWAAGVLRKHTKLPVSVWRHGVASDFQLLETDSELVMKSFDDGMFEVLHLASTAKQRKGTRELIQAWVWLMRSSELPKKAKLFIVLEGAAEEFMQLADGEKSVIVTTRLNVNADTMAHIYRQRHLVVQPSRGEGFGMVPLEAMACGVPVCLTTCTGHSEYFWHPGVGPGGVAIRTGQAEPIDDGPGALAPSLAVEDVRMSLKSSYDNWSELFIYAQRFAPKMREAWSWPAVTRQWLDCEEGA